MDEVDLRYTILGIILSALKATHAQHNKFILDNTNKLLTPEHQLHLEASRLSLSG